MRPDITQILRRYDHDPNELARRLIPVVYDTLRSMAHARMKKERRDLTLQATALVHEAYLRLLGGRTSWKNRRHFFGAAAEAMRRILIEQARRRRRVRHGGQLQRVQIDPESVVHDPNMPDALVLDDALDRLEAHDPRKAVVVKLRYYLGFSIAETAEVLEVSPTTVKMEWQYARAWLHRALADSSQPAPALDEDPPPTRHE